MAKVTAPFLSFSGSGSIAKSMVASKWRGIKYMRQHVVPANPKTIAQQTNRAIFALTREMWKIAPALLRAPWDAFAAGRPLTGMNKFVGENVRVFQGEIDMTNFIGSPGALGGLPPDTVTIVGGGASGEIDVTSVNPAAPTGWAITGLVACAFLDQAPDGIFSGAIVAAEDAVTFNSITFAGLTGGTDYCVAAWLRWEKPDGKTAYSVGVTDIVAATV